MTALALAEQPRYLGGVLDADSSQTGARFVVKCSQFAIVAAALSMLARGAAQLGDFA